MAVGLGILGASGRAGSQVVKVLPEFPDFRLKAALVAPCCPTLGRLCLSAEENHGEAVSYSSDLAAAAGACEAFIDFSTPESSLALLRLASQNAKPLFIGTTGFSDAQMDEVRELARKSPVLVAPNASFGVLVLRRLVKQAKRMLGPGFDSEILEVHHAMKKDAPSGTALTIGRDLTADFPSKLLFNRRGLRQEGEIGIASLRGGDVCGDHTVFFFGPSERLELTHRITDRAVFARGALKALEQLITCPPGLYSLEDMFKSV